MVLDPSGAIERRAQLAIGRGSAWFTSDDLDVLSEVDGRCSYVQSLRSEDTLTWTAFGQRVDDEVIAALLELAFGSRTRPSTFSREHWARHPDPAHAASGPAPDVTLRADGWAYVVEAKWGADLDHEQGVTGTTSQLAMRARVAESLCGDPEQRGVLVVVPSPQHYAWARSGVFARYFVPRGSDYEPLPTATALGARAVTWEQMLEVIEARQPGSEVASYLRWRLWYAPSAARRSRPTRPLIVSPFDRSTEPQR
jgi:hypothetical protein